MSCILYFSENHIAILAQVRRFFNSNVSNLKLKMLSKTVEVKTDFSWPWATIIYEHKIVNIIYQDIYYCTNSIESILTWILFNLILKL